jgi:hypothetical protein
LRSLQALRTVLAFALRVQLARQGFDLGGLAGIEQGSQLRPGGIGTLRGEQASGGDDEVDHGPLPSAGAGRRTSKLLSCAAIAPPASLRSKTR